MIRILALLAVVFIGLFFGPEIGEYKGYVLISFDRYKTYETTVINAGFMMLAFYFVLFFVELILRKVLSMNKKTRSWLDHRSAKKRKKNVLKGTLALLEGNSRQAYKLLSKSAAHSDTPMMTHISAAQAAHLQGRTALRDKELDQATATSKGAELPVKLIKVELQIDEKDYAGALVSLRELPYVSLKTEKVILLHLNVYAELFEWASYIKLLSESYKKLKFTEQQFEEKLSEAYRHYFAQLGQNSADKLRSFWLSEVPKRFRKELNYQRILLDAYVENSYSDYAAEFLLSVLKKNISKELLAYLSEIKTKEGDGLTTLLEKKLKRSPTNASLNQALGRLKLKQGNEKDATKYLLASVEHAPCAKDFYLVATLLDKAGEEAEANLYYRKGLSLSQEKEGSGRSMSTID